MPAVKRRVNGGECHDRYVKKTLFSLLPALQSDLASHWGSPYVAGACNSEHRLHRCHLFVGRVPVLNPTFKPKTIFSFLPTEQLLICVGLKSVYSSSTMSRPRTGSEANRESRLYFHAERRKTVPYGKGTSVIASEVIVSRRSGCAVQPDVGLSVIASEARRSLLRLSS